jgi:hypothetical protein
MQVKTLYLSDDGRIEGIEFEGWGWYLMQRLMHYIPNYLSNMKTGFITNTKRFDSIDFQSVLDEFARDDFKEAYSYSAFSTKYGKEKMLKKIFDGFDELKPKAQILYLKKLNGLSKQNIYAYFALMFRV